MKRPWFKAKKYGWGWGLPATWQGWLVFLGYIVFIILESIYNARNYPHSLHKFLMLFLLQLLIATIIFAIIVILTGEKPQWRWGTKK